MYKKLKKLKQAKDEVILKVLKKPGMIMSRVTIELKLTYAHAAPLINEMVDAGIFRKEVNDGRSFKLFLTDKGKAIADATKTYYKEWGL
jgi:predicted transcriptional regulator